MILLCKNFHALSEDIKQNNKRVIMFGAGAIGQVTTPEILKSLGLLDSIGCYLDNNQSMWSEKISACGRDFEVRSPQYLNECPAGTVILLNISRFSDVIEQLEGMECTKDMECYIMPMILIHNFCSAASQGAAILSDKPLIPKKLHYMWLGGNPLPDSLKKCIDSWKRYCPDYEIIEWNEDNYDIGKHPYMKQAYDAKAYGFVPDYARLDILYNEGGLYLDTDVEIKRNIDDLLYQEAFCGVEKWQVINFGGLSGAVKNHPMVKKFLDTREDIMFLDSEGKQNRNTCGFYDTRVAIDAGYKIDGTTQNVGGMNIYAYDYFQPYDYMSGLLNETENTHSVHWFNGGWLDEKMKKINEESRERYLELYKRALSVKSVRSRFSSFEMTQYIFWALGLEDASKTTNGNTFKNHGYGGSLNDLFMIVEDLAIHDGKIEKIMDIPRTAWGHGYVRKVCGSGTNLNNHEINLFMERVYFLMNQMVIVPGDANDVSTSLPLIHVTEYGLKCIEEREILPYDVDGYLERVRACRKHDEWDVHYIGECLKCFNAGVYDAATIILGIEGEYLADRVVKSYLAFLDKNEANEKISLDAVIKGSGGKISKEYQEYSKSVNRIKKSKDSQGSFKYPDLNALSPQLDGAGHDVFMNYLRLTRNEIAHPSNGIMEASETMLLIVSFLKYFEIQNKFLEYYEDNS